MDIYNVVAIYASGRVVSIDTNYTLQDAKDEMSLHLSRSGCIEVRVIKIDRHIDR